MKLIICIALFFLSATVLAKDSVGVVEPQQSGSRNYDLLWMSVAGLLILVAMYFLFRKTRRIKN